MDDEYSIQYGKESVLVSRRYSYNIRLNLLRTALNKKNGYIIDIGSASGDYSLDLFDISTKIICFDINLKNLKIARNKDNNLSPIYGDAHTLPFKNESIDAIVIFNAFRYFNNPKYFLNESYRVLKKEGSLILIEHNKYCPDSLFIKKNVVYYYSLKQIKRLIQGTNFKISDEKILFIPPPLKSKCIFKFILWTGQKIMPAFEFFYPEFFIHAIK